MGLNECPKKALGAKQSDGYKLYFLSQWPNQSQALVETQTWGSCPGPSAAFCWVRCLSEPRSPQTIRRTIKAASRTSERPCVKVLAYQIVNK